MFSTMRAAVFTVSKPCMSLPAGRIFSNGIQKCGASSRAGNRFSGMNQKLKSATNVINKTGSISGTVAGEGAFTAGRIAAGAFAGVCLGGLCWYSAGMNTATSGIDKATVWPDYVRDRIKNTYFYFGGSIAATAGSVVLAVRSPAAMRLVSAYGWKSLIASMGLLLGTNITCQMLPYQPGQLSLKHIAWLAHSGAVGLVIAPLCLMGGPIVSQAALYTAGIVGGLSALAMTAPSDKFLYMGGPLAIGSGVVMASCIGTWFLPATGMLGAGMHSIAIYGGLILFSGFMLYDTQRIMHKAEQHPVTYGSNFGGVAPYDPINSSISIYMDAVNIFIRMVMILSGGNRKR